MLMDTPSRRLELERYRQQAKYHGRSDWAKNLDVHGVQQETRHKLDTLRSAAQRHRQDYKARQEAEQLKLKEELQRAEEERIKAEEQRLAEEEEATRLVLSEEEESEASSCLPCC